MRIGLLGPLEVRTEGGDDIVLGGARLRTLVIILALEPGRVVSTTRLVDGIWGDAPPAGAVNAVQALVSRLRRTLPAPIESHPAGYRLVLEPDAVDATRFERLVAAGRAALTDDPASASRSCLLGDPAGSAAAMAEAERDAERSGWPDGLATLAFAKAELARWSGDLETARAQLFRTEEVIRHIAVHPVFRAMVRDSLGYVDAMAGDLEAAGALRAEALILAVESQHAPTIALVLVGLADQAARRGLFEEAARLLAASVAVRGGPDLSNQDAARVETAARAALGAPEFADATRAGGRVTVETVREIAAVTLDRG